MNRNLKQSLWVLALGIAFTGFSTTSRAALPAQRDLDQDRNQNRTRNDNPKGDRVYFQQGVQDGQHDRQFGGNRSEHPQPNDADLRNQFSQARRHTRSNPSTCKARREPSGEMANPSLC